MANHHRMALHNNVAHHQHEHEHVFTEEDTNIEPGLVAPLRAERSIVVPTASQKHSCSVVHWARMHLLRPGDEVVLLNCGKVDTSTVSQEDIVAARAETGLDLYAQKIGVVDKLQTKTLIMKADPRDGIPSVALMKNAEIVVVGAHDHRSKLKKLILGSVSESCVRHVHSTVIVVHNPPVPEHGEQLQPVSRPPRNILLPFEQQSGSWVLDWTLKHIVFSGDTLTLLHVAPEGTIDRTKLEWMTAYSNELYTKGPAVLDGGDGAGGEVTPQYPPNIQFVAKGMIGEPRQAILDAASEYKPDMIVMGAKHNLMISRRERTGKNAPYIASHADVPVAVVANPELQAQALKDFAEKRLEFRAHQEAIKRKEAPKKKDHKKGEGGASLRFHDKK